MPRPRVPKAKAIASGRTSHDPKRFKNRTEPKVTKAIGQPPKWMKPDQAKAWKLFSDELPWLNGSHRALLEIASVIRARVTSGEDVGVQALNLLRQCLGQMGATPADSSKISADDEEDDNDPADKYFT